MLTLNKCQLYGSIPTHSSSLLKLTKNLLSTGDRESLAVVPVAQEDAAASGFTLIDHQGVSTLPHANWGVVCLVPKGGGTISSPLKNDPAVSLGGSIPTLLNDDLAVGLSLEDSREEVSVLSMRGPSEGSWVRAALLQQGVQTGFSGCEVPTPGCLFSVAS